MVARIMPDKPDDWLTAGGLVEIVDIDSIHASDGEHKLLAGYLAVRVLSDANRYCQRTMEEFGFNAFMQGSQALEGLTPSAGEMIRLAKQRWRAGQGLP